MANTRKGRKRPMGKYLKGNIDEDLALGTLAAGALVSDAWDEAAEERTLVSSIVASWTLDNLTGGQGPLLFGVAHGAYTDAQIEEVIENAGSWSPGDLISQEIAKRKVRVIGTFTPEEAAAVVDIEFNDGKPVKTKLNWVLQSDARIRMWVYNISGGALSGTAPILRANGHANLWLK